MRFESWPVLFLLLLIPLLHYFFIRKKRHPSIHFPIPIPGDAGVRSPTFWILFLQYVALSALIIGLARPQNSHRQTQRTVSGVDIMMVMDVSHSMNIEDLSERSRFEMAKDVMRSFVQGRQNDRIGFVAFSGEPITLAPPTLDYGLVLKSISDIEIGMLKDGTAIGDGLSIAVNRLRNSTAKSKVVILLTDGDNNVGQVDPATAGELAAGYGIRVYTIAMGREGRVKMPIRQKTPLGKVITTYQWFESALNPELLQHIAKITSGKFYRVTEATALESVYKEIDLLERSEVTTTEKVRYDERFMPFAKVALLMLALAWILKNIWWRMA